MRTNLHLIRFDQGFRQNPGPTGWGCWRPLSLFVPCFNFNVDYFFDVLYCFCNTLTKWRKASSYWLDKSRSFSHRQGDIEVLKQERPFHRFNSSALELLYMVVDTLFDDEFTFCFMISPSPNFDELFLVVDLICLHRMSRFHNNQGNVR